MESDRWSAWSLLNDDGHLIDEPAILPGDWYELLQGGQVFTALLLSTSYSEKYRGRHMQPLGSAFAERKEGSIAQLRIPSRGGDVAWHPSLLHRSGNREAVAFIWEGDNAHGDSTIYVCFSPLRYRSQFLKICCAGLAKNGMSARRAAQQTDDLSVGQVMLPVSTYLKVKLDRLWDPMGDQRLYDKLLQSVQELRSHRVIFSGISHGAALAQAAALKFQIQQQETKVFVVTWNAYRWTDASGREAAEHFLGQRMLHFVLSRREIYQANRYWDSVTGFPRELSPMPNSVLLDADTGRFYKHTDPEQGSQFGSAFLMRMFELHFARSALGAIKKATANSVGEESLVHEEYLLNKRLEALQERFFNNAQKVAKASHKAQDLLRKRTSGVYSRQLDRQSRTEVQFKPYPCNENGDHRPTNGANGRHADGWFKRLAWCCSSQ